MNEILDYVRDYLHSEKFYTYIERQSSVYPDRQVVLARVDFLGVEKRNTGFSFCGGEWTLPPDRPTDVWKFEYKGVNIAKKEFTWTVEKKIKDLIIQRFEELGWDCVKDNFYIYAGDISYGLSFRKEIN